MLCGCRLRRPCYPGRSNRDGRNELYRDIPQAECVRNSFGARNAAERARTARPAK